MKQRPRIYYSETQKALMWDRWRKGDTIHQIAKLFDRGHSSIQRILSENGGSLNYCVFLKAYAVVLAEPLQSTEIVL